MLGQGNAFSLFFDALAATAAPLPTRQVVRGVRIAAPVPRNFVGPRTVSISSLAADGADLAPGLSVLDGLGSSGLGVFDGFEELLFHKINHTLTVFAVYPFCLVSPSRTLPRESPAAP